MGCTKPRVMLSLSRHCTQALDVSSPDKVAAATWRNIRNKRKLMKVEQVFDLFTDLSCAPLNTFKMMLLDVGTFSIIQKHLLIFSALIFLTSQFTTVHFEPTIVDLSFNGYCRCSFSIVDISLIVDFSSLHYCRC